MPADFQVWPPSFLFSNFLTLLINFFRSSCLDLLPDSSLSPWAEAGCGLTAAVLLRAGVLERVLERLPLLERDLDLLLLLLLDPLLDLDLDLDLDLVLRLDLRLNLDLDLVLLERVLPALLLLGDLVLDLDLALFLPGSSA